MDFKENTDLIYKYSPFSLNLLRLLITGELWFGNVKDLNDPYEGEFIPKMEDKIPDKIALKKFYQDQPFNLSEQELENKLKQLERIPQQFHDDFTEYVKDRVRREYGVTCFSSDPTQITMWSHYASSHTGICLAFNQKELIQSLRKTYPEIKIGEVLYENSLPKVSFKHNEEGFYYETEDDIVLRKHVQWIEEKEIRLYFRYASLLDKTEKRYVPFNRNSLKGIILGQKISENDATTLFHLILNHRGYQDITWWKAKKNLKDLTMDISSIRPVIQENGRVKLET